MAAPPPEGLSPWPQDLPVAAATDRLPLQEPGEAPAPRGLTRRRSLPPTPGVTPWLWLPMALSSLLLVLFLVVVNRQQAQAQRLSELLSRVQDLEHSRALERTAVLEQQLRSMLTRLQELEKRNQRQEQLGQELQALQQQLQQLRAARPLAAEPLDSAAEPDESRRPAGSRPPPPPLP